METVVVTVSYFSLSDHFHLFCFVHRLQHEVTESGVTKDRTGTKYDQIKYGGLGLRLGLGLAAGVVFRDTRNKETGK